MTTISHLPEELLKEIMGRIPLNYTGAMRLTCKNWDALLRNRTFMRIGEGAEAAREGESRMVVLMDSNIYLTSIFFNGTDIDPTAEQKGKRISLNDDSEIKISQVFHCEGLLLCVLKDDKFRLVVWNPYWGQTRWIEPRYTFLKRDRVDRYSYALGYENKSGRQSHKILRFIDTLFYFPSAAIFWYEIYDFESNIWTTLDFTTPHWCISYGANGVSLKGNTYWCATKRNSQNNYQDRIVCFDFTSEKFGPLLRLPVRAWDETLVTISCVREENLAALYGYHEGGIEVWITTKIEAKKVSWSKFLKVDIDGNAEIPSLLSRLSFFIDEAKKVAMIFDKMSNRDDSVNIIGEAGYIRQVYLGEPSDRTCSITPLVCSYVPSLKQIKQPARGGKRQKQSSLEKRLYDQYMSRLVPHEEPFGVKRKQQSSLENKFRLVPHKEPGSDENAEPSKRRKL